MGNSKSPTYTGVDLTNLRGDVRLEWLRIVRWSGEPPREVQADQARIHRTDGSIVYGQVTRFDAASREFLVKSGEGAGETRIAPEKISSVFLSLPGDEKPQGLRAVYRDGSRYTGELQKVEKGVLALKVPGVPEILRLPVAGLRSLVILTEAEAEAPVKDESSGRLEISGVRLNGKLVDASNKAGASCLAWHPTSSETASALEPGVSGRIIYKEPQPPPPVTQQMTQQMQLQLQQQQQRAQIIRRQQLQAATARAGGRSGRRSHGASLHDGDGRADERAAIDKCQRRETLPVPARR